MSECSGLEGLLGLAFLFGLVAIVCFIVRNFEKTYEGPNNKQDKPKNDKKEEKDYDIKAHIGSKVCVERKVKRAENLGPFDYEYKAEIGTIIGKRKETLYCGYESDVRYHWLVQFEDGETEEYGYYDVYTDYSEELVKTKEVKNV